MTQEDRKVAREQDGDQAMVEVSPGGTEGGRRPTGVPPGEAGVRALAQGQRWTAPRKREVVLRIFRGEPLDLLSRELGVELYRRKTGETPPWRAWRLPSRPEAATPSRQSWTTPCSASVN